MAEDVLTKLMFFVYFPIVGAGLVGGFILRWRLRQHHRDVWIDLGSSTIGNQDIATGLKYLRFLFNGRHRALNDPLVTWLIWAGRAAFVSTMGMLIFFLGVVLVASPEQAPSAPPSSDTTITASGTPMFTHDSTGWKLHRPPDLILFLSVFTFIYFGVVRSLLVHLKRVHTDIWRELGEPLFFLNNTPRNGLRVLGFVMSDRHVTLKDRKLTIYIYVMRVLMALLIAALFWPKDSSRFFS